ncbi:MAG TPA: nuclear transport factor 2 family protein [Actinophytocola sp.]|uniref:nuclear transport factor 2 family protein n=1 Tax=Actinophytocola sp. TaxID=1872138 RepID=UPI002DDD57B7|nr:nuclear transport factor 2 family protein [Actinophytocola sp.]HEV2780628.1 nuclear transport factor 2 family protein [Actinophytocola sp.]
MTISQPTEVSALLDRYLVSLDYDKLDDEWARGLFTEDARVVFPMSEHAGIDGLAEYHRNALAAWKRTHSLGSTAVVEIDGDLATLRANLTTTHVHLAENAPPGGERDPLFVAGTAVSGQARRTPDGWRLSLLSVELVWATGSPPPMP